MLSNRRNFYARFRIFYVELLPTLTSLSRREAVLIEAMDNIPAAFVVYDKNDQLIVCNAKFREF